MAFEVGDKIIFPEASQIRSQDVVITQVPKNQTGTIKNVYPGNTNEYDIEVFDNFVIHNIPESFIQEKVEAINGRRYRIICAICDRLKLINRKNPIPRTASGSQSGTPADFYPIDINYVSLRSETPDSLIGDKLLPALLVQYGDGMRSYRTGKEAYARIGEVTEYMTVIVRAVVQQMRNPENPMEFIPLTLVIANLHEAIESAIGDGPNLGIDGVRAIMTPKWDTHDCWGLDFEVIDFHIKILHVFKRGEGV